MDISVVVPTCDRIAALRRTLAALALQQLDGLRAEVVVVDTGRAGETANWISGQIDRFPYPLRLITAPAAGVSEARNRAVASAEGRLILSINDDTTPASPRLVAGHVRAHEPDGALAVLGRISYPAEMIDADPFMAWLNDDAQFAFGRLERGERPLPNHYYTAHLSFPRSSFERVGGMDDRLRFGFEDAEFGARMLRAGVPLRYRADLVLIHHHAVTQREWRERAERMGAAGALVNRFHPQTPPLAQPATGLYWQALALADRLLGWVPTDWRSAPSWLRRAIYIIINQGSYARGYRGD